MRVLLIESDPEDVLFLRDVLTEIGEAGYFDNWVKIEVLEASSWSEAWAILESEPLDIVLLDLDFPDTQGIETFRRAQHAAPHLPMVLLVGTFEESLGLWLIRDGAQDFLVKKHVDCAPLAHAMRSAIERHRLLTASRAVFDSRYAHRPVESHRVSNFRRSRRKTRRKARPPFDGGGRRKSHHL